MGVMSVTLRWMERHLEVKALVVLPLLIWAFWSYVVEESSVRKMDYLSIMAVAAHFIVIVLAVKVFACAPFKLVDGRMRPRFKSAVHVRRSFRVFLYNKRKHFFRSSVGDAIDMLVMLLAVGACCMYVVETYSPALVTRIWWQGLELALSMAFCMDHLIRLAVAPDALVYLLSVQGIINVVTFLPVMIYVLHRFASDNAAGNFYGSSLSYLRLLRLSKLLRILKGLNIVRSAPSDNLRMELFTLVFTVICMVFSAAGLFHWLENDDDCAGPDIWNVFKSNMYDTNGDGGCLYFHTALYLCTIEVLGRPRLIMQRDYTVCMVIGLVALSVVVIPSKMAGVLQVMQRTNKYQRLYYVPSTWWSKHLVIVGHKDFTSISMFLYEFFHAERGQHSVQDVVMLFAGQPSADFEALLCDPLYAGHVTYLQGTPLQEKDLERACLTRAAGVILMANKDAESSTWHDGELVTCIQSMKAFWLKEVVRQSKHTAISGSQEAAKLLRPRIVAQVMLPRTKAYLKALPGWTQNDVVIVCSEYISEMLSMATNAKGMATLMFNLVSHIDKQPKYRTKWYKRYEDGARQEIYAANVDGGRLECSNLVDAAKLLAEQQCILLAAKRMAVDGVEVHLFPGPEGFVLEKGDKIFCISKSAPELNAVVAGLSGRKLKEVDKLAVLDTGAESMMLPGLSIRQTSTKPAETMIERIGTQVEEAIGDFSAMRARVSNKSLPGIAEHEARQAPNHPPGLQRRGTRDHSEEKLNMSVDAYLMENPDLAQACAERVKRRSEVSMLRATTKSHAAWLKPDEVRARLQERQPPWADHVVLIGMPFCHADSLAVGYGAVTAFMELLEEVGVNEVLGKPKGIMVVDEEAEKHLLTICQMDEYVMKMVQNRRIRAVTGDPRHQDTLIQFANIGSARAIVAVPEDVCKAAKRSLFSVEDGNRSLRLKLVKQIVDTNTVLTMQMAKEYALLVQETARTILGSSSALTPVHSNAEDDGELLGASHHCVTLLLQETTTNLFFGHAHMRHVGAADPRRDFTPINMSPLFAAGEIIAATCCDRLVAEAFFNKHLLQLISVLFHGDNSNHRLRQQSCPPQHVGYDYVDVLMELIDSSQIMLGILRVPNEQTGETFFVGENCDMPNLPDTNLPYVVTNPSRGDIFLQETDLLFVVGPHTDESETQQYSKPLTHHRTESVQEEEKADEGDGAISLTLSI